MIQQLTGRSSKNSKIMELAEGYYYARLNYAGWLSARTATYCQHKDYSAEKAPSFPPA
jgi:hypothetical protein